MSNIVWSEKAVDYFKNLLTYEIEIDKLKPEDSEFVGKTFIKDAKISLNINNTVFLEILSNQQTLFDNYYNDKSVETNLYNSVPSACYKQNNLEILDNNNVKYANGVFIRGIDFYYDNNKMDVYFSIDSIYKK